MVIILHFESETSFWSKLIRLITWRTGRSFKAIFRCCKMCQNFNNNPKTCSSIVARILLGYTPTIEFYGTSSQNAPEGTHCPRICREETWAQMLNPYHTNEQTLDAILLLQRSVTACYARRFLSKQSATFEPRLLLDQFVDNESTQEKMRWSLGPPWWKKRKPTCIYKNKE